MEIGSQRQAPYGGREGWGKECSRGADIPKSKAPKRSTDRERQQMQRRTQFKVAEERLELHFSRGAVTERVP